MIDDIWLLLPVWYAAFLLSTTCHEAAHAAAAYLGGDATAYHGGQVSLNPLPHMRREPVGTILVPILSFLYFGWADGGGTRWMIGWASAPFDPWWEDRHPRRAALMAAAGPAANLLLAAIVFTALHTGLGSGVFVPPASDVLALDHLVQPAVEGGALDGIGRLLSVLLTLNLVLFVFNLMPFPPLDGASVLAGLSSPARRALEWVRSNPMFGLLGLLLAWRVFSPIFAWVYGPVLQALYRGT